MKNRENFYQKIIYLNLIFILFFSCGVGKKDNKNFKFLAALIFQSDTNEASSESFTNEKIPKNEKSPPEVEPVENLDIKDPLYKDQWHLKNTEGTLVSLKNGRKTRIDINVEPVWKQGYFGKGMKVGIFDTAIEYTHPDLKDNLPPENVINNYPNDLLCKGGKNASPHGTLVAGIIASKDNKIGTRGVVPHATLYGYAVARANSDVWFPVREILKALKRSEFREIVVYNGSIIDGSNAAHERNLGTNATEQKVLKAFDKVTRDGFGGLGASLVFSAGNDAYMFGTSANNQFLNHYAVIAVNSISEDGTITATERAPHGWLGESGANLWLISPTEVTTTDLVGACGKDEGNYYKVFNGTSGAAPSVSGVIALLRQAYPKLTWRDVKLILAESAKKIATNPDKDLPWKITGKMYSNPTKNQEYQRAMGFGLVDAGAAFELADSWKLLPTMKTETFENTVSLNTQAKDILHTSNLNIEGSQIKFIESVVLDLEIERTEKLELHYWALSLVSPDGKITWIYKKLNSLYEAMFLEDVNNLQFLSNAFLGNSTVNGNWKLRLQIKDNDNNEGKITEIKNWKLTIRGH